MEIRGEKFSKGWFIAGVIFSLYGILNTIYMLGWHQYFGVDSFEYLILGIGVICGAYKGKKKIYYILEAIFCLSYLAIDLSMKFIFK